MCQQWLSCESFLAYLCTPLPIGTHVPFQPKKKAASGYVGPSVHLCMFDLCILVSDRAIPRTILEQSHDVILTNVCMHVGVGGSGVSVNLRNRIVEKTAAIHWHSPCSST